MSENQQSSASRGHSRAAGEQTDVSAKLCLIRGAGMRLGGCRGLWMAWGWGAYGRPAHSQSGLNGELQIRVQAHGGQGRLGEGC